jgi:hypothetical protein
MLFPANPQVGDTYIGTVSRPYIWTGNAWQPYAIPSGIDLVESVAGKTGVVTLENADISNAVKTPTYTNWRTVIQFSKHFRVRRGRKRSVRQRFLYCGCSRIKQSYRAIFNKPLTGLIGPVRTAPFFGYSTSVTDVNNFFVLDSWRCCVYKS